MLFERTVARAVSCQGIGLHTGVACTLRLVPAGAGTGRVFVRTDKNGFEIPATLDHVGRANYATCLVREGVRISTAEHLLAALYALGVDNVRLELDAEEVPILDGSAARFVTMIQEAGIADQALRREYITMVRPLTLVEEDKQISIHPASGFRVTYAIDFEHPSLGYQELTADLWGTSAFVEKLAPARTFVLEKDVEALRRAGLAKGGNLDNAVVLGESGNLSGPLRFADEPVRHKMLDLTGDLSLLGHPLKGHVVAYRAGHDLHAALAQMIAHRPDAWHVSGWDDAAAPTRAARSVRDTP
jgi:UDP-3-O-[3-hydroxymyristoyl] N-acetylglucosamine deacetylase